MNDDKDDQGLRPDMGAYVEEAREPSAEDSESDDSDSSSDEGLLSKVKDAIVGNEEQIKSDDEQN